MLYILNVNKENNIYKLTNIINQSTGEILSLIDFLCVDGIVYVNNLDFAFMEICKELLKLKYKNVFKAQKQNQFSFVYKNGECLQIKIIKANNKHLTIVNFEKKFLQPFTTYENNIALVDYAIKKNRVSASLGVDAFNEFLLQAFKSHGQQVKNIHACKEIFRRRDYPIIEDAILNQAKENTSGYQIALQGLYENIYHYDICSSYPAQLCDNTPIGKPKEFDSISKIPSSYFYIIKFTAFDITIKESKIDFLNANNKNIITTTLTQHLFDLFLDNYNYTALKIKRILAFKTTKDRFKQFIQDNIINGKINENLPCISKYNKAIANSVVGYFGKNNITQKTKIIRNKGKIAILTANEKTQQIYLPLYLYVTGKAKKEFITTLQKVGMQNIIYANTDGFLCKHQINLNKINNNVNDVLGSYKQKPKINKIYIDCINGYCAETETGEIDNTLAGMRTPDTITVEQYITKEFKYVINEIDSNGNICEHIVDRKKNI